MGQKDLKMGLRNHGMVWYGLVVILGSWAEFELSSNCPEYQSLKSDFFEFVRNFETQYERHFKFLVSVQTSWVHNLAIPNQPYQTMTF